tara:strand:+ start:678 stop:1016 length:339 start_codon:yes stop_codon:yes gene_type:complete
MKKYILLLIVPFLFNCSQKKESWSDLDKKKCESFIVSSIGEAPDGKYMLENNNITASKVASCFCDKMGNHYKSYEEFENLGKSTENDMIFQYESMIECFGDKEKQLELYENL